MSVRVGRRSAGPIPYNRAASPKQPVYSDLDILCLAAAGVVDTVLLLAVLGRQNRRYVLTPVVVLILGGWLWHAGAFAYALLLAAERAGTAGAWAAGPTWAAMVVMTLGLLLMPSAMLHGLWRVRRTGLATMTPPHPAYLWAYLPVLAAGPLAWHLAGGRADALYVDRVWPFVPAYGAWLAGADVAAVVGFRRLRRDPAAHPYARRFYAAMATALVGLLALHAFAFLVAVPAWPGHRAGWLLAVMLSPVAPAAVFAYNVVRHEFMRVVVERTAVYAAVVVAVLLLHEMLVRPVTAQLSGRLGLNVAVVEVLAVLGLFGAYPPLRQRAAEALRYLMGERVAPLRDSARRLAVTMSERAADPPAELARWFAPALREALGVRNVGVWLFDAAGGVAVRVGGWEKRSVGQDADGPGATDAQADANVRGLRDALRASGMVACGSRDAPDQTTLDQLESAGASLVVSLRHRQVDGLVLVGRRAGNRGLGQEQANAAVLLAEQLAVTLNVGLLHADRLAAERRALQREKLATLGLVAGSIAHEVKNPLSSIKTIATVLAEELGPDDPRSQDVRLIRDEVDRLAGTVAKLLRFARPACGSAAGRATPVADVLAGSVLVMGYVARQRDVAVHYSADDGLPPVPADEDALREVFTNLIANAIEAAAAGASDGGTVWVTARRSPEAGADAGVRVEVADDGAGLPDAVRGRLFEPFATGRDGGTGLGLYIVGRRMSELGGTVRHDRVAVDGSPRTRFTVDIPAVVAMPATRA